MGELGPVEIKVKYSVNQRQWNSHPRRGAGNGLRKRPQRNPLPKDMREAAQAATKANQTVLLLEQGRHRRFTRASTLGGG